MPPIEGEAECQEQGLAHRDANGQEFRSLHHQKLSSGQQKSQKSPLQKAKARQAREDKAADGEARRIFAAESDSRARQHVDPKTGAEIVFSQFNSRGTPTPTVDRLGT
jgi:hypothetical protein